MNLVWTCLGRVDMVTPQVLDEMARAGCWQIWFGLESGSDEILEKIKKGISTKQIKEAVIACKKAGIQPCGSFIVGSPGETKATALQTIDFAKNLPLAEAHYCFMTPFPGSELYNNWKAYGSFKNDWKKLHGWEPVFIPNGMTREELIMLNKDFFRSFYFRPRIVLQYLHKIKSIKHLNFYFQGFLALFELIFKSFKSKSSLKKDT